MQREPRRGRRAKPGVSQGPAALTAASAQVGSARPWAWSGSEAGKRWESSAPQTAAPTPGAPGSEPGPPEPCTPTFTEDGRQALRLGCRASAPLGHVEADSLGPRPSTLPVLPPGAGAAAGEGGSPLGGGRAFSLQEERCASEHVPRLPWGGHTAARTCG